ncbi:MAG: hypothetical protein LBM70_03840 [Victivallales bacterium]|jgi:alpha-galactosidase|nr:hypothetical protein [Victivallales bacterium]
MPKIVLVGAGGVIFAQNFIKDILNDPVLRTFDVTLMDIDAERLAKSVTFAGMIAEKLGIEFNPHSTTDLREALTGANYVITIFRSGVLHHQELEYEIPMKYGVDQVVSDTLGPGGIFRGLRTIKPLFEVLDCMEEVCPGAYLLNYVNPMSLNTIALSKRAKTVKVVGLCHSVQHTSRQIAEWIGVPHEKLHFRAAGINHMAFMLSLEVDGEDVYPKLFACLDKPEIYKQEKVRFEIMRNFGYFPTESSGHNSEYLPYFRKRQDLIDRFCCNDCPKPDEYGIDWSEVSSGVTGAAIEVCRKQQFRNEQQIKEYLEGTRPIDLTSSVEYGVQIIAAIEKNQPISANLNVMNRGLIASLPPECCVEVPCLVDGGGIVPGRIENFPEQLAAIDREMINPQVLAAEGALNGDRRAIFHAIATDPNTQCKLGLDEIQAMTNELFEVLSDQIDPRFS